jgi:hypothetical protein
MEEETAVTRFTGYLSGETDLLIISATNKINVDPIGRAV